MATVERAGVAPRSARGAARALAVALVLGAPAARPVPGGEAAADATRVKAAFLRNFARYVTWPPEAFSDARSPWQVGVLGDDPFGDVLERTFQGRTEQERTFQIHRARSLDRLPRCQIVVVALRGAGERRAALEALRRGPVLTVGEAPEFLQEGGVVRLDVADRVQLSINLDQARASSLRIQTKMLEVSHELLEHGVVRRAR